MTKTDIEQIKADREAGTHGPWEIHWFECKADHRDVEYAKSKGENIAVGDVLWSVPYEVGPIGVDSNHWAGEYLGVGDVDARRIARVPELEAALIEVVEVLRGALADHPYPSEIKSFLERFK